MKKDGFEQDEMMFEEDGSEAKELVEPSEDEFEISSEPADAPDGWSASDEEEELLAKDPNFVADGTELEDFESVEIEEREFLPTEQIQSIVESILFATEKPQSLALIKQAFKGTQVRTKDIKDAIHALMIDYASGSRGFTLEEINGGYQLRTKVDNMEFLKGMVKARPFKLSGPALEVMSIVAYKQPIIKAQIDEIRGVESGHLLRALMEKSLVAFAGKSEFPGKPMLYQTTRKFLEIFGLRNLKELPSLSEIDELIPEGIGEEEEKETLGDITDQMAEQAKDSYSEGEEELLKITEQLSDISTSSEFFEQEKARQKTKRDAEKAQDIREAIAVGEEVSTRDRNWLERYEVVDQFDREGETAQDLAAPSSDGGQSALVAEDGSSESDSEDDDMAVEPYDDFADTDGATDEGEDDIETLDK